MHAFKKILAVGALSIAGLTSAHAAKIQIQMSGLDLIYNEGTGALCDAGGTATCGVEAFDALSTMEFFIDGVLQLTYNANISIGINLFVAPGSNPLTTAIYSTIPNLGIFDARVNNAPGLFTDVTTGNLIFTNTGVNANGTGFASTVLQNLPLGLVAYDPINWSFSSGLGNCTGEVGSRICTYSGTGELAWFTPRLPEPGTLLMLGLGLIGIGASAQRRKA